MQVDTAMCLCVQVCPFVHMHVRMCLSVQVCVE